MHCAVGGQVQAVLSCRGLWTLFGLKVLESFNYFSLSIVLTLYLTEEYGVSDVHVSGSAFVPR